MGACLCVCMFVCTRVFVHVCVNVRVHPLTYILYKYHFKAVEILPCIVIQLI